MVKNYWLEVTDSPTLSSLIVCVMPALVLLVVGVLANLMLRRRLPQQPGWRFPKTVSYSALAGIAIALLVAIPLPIDVGAILIAVLFAAIAAKIVWRARALVPAAFITVGTMGLFTCFTASAILIASARFGPATNWAIAFDAVSWLWPFIVVPGLVSALIAAFLSAKTEFESASRQRFV